MALRKYCILVTILLIALTGVAAAHPPAALQLSYSEQTGEVLLTVTHVVEDPATHFIQQAEVRKNGETVISERYTGQPATGTFTYQYPVPLSAGDEVVATAECNIGGSATARFIMPGQTGTIPTEPGTTPLWVYHAILMVIGILCILTAGLLPVYGKRIAGWYRLHIIAAIAGSILVIPAAILVFRFPYLSASPSAFAVHVVLGLLLLFSLLAAILLALIRSRVGPRKAAIRSVHIWAGRAFIVLVVINILLGLVAVGII
ncbi:MAG: hypothetical protein LUQ33_01565 [Methanoregulaceae archaeon]|nr:hypothetical protein [Methanoregulaceae archaeon]